MGTGNLDRLAKLDALTVDLNTEVGLDRVGDHGGSNGAKQHALVADLGVDGNGLAIDGLLERVGVGNADGLALLNVVATLLELLQIALGCRNGELLREQVVLGVTLSDVYDVTLATLALDLTQENDFHEISLRKCTTYAVRKRLLFCLLHSSLLPRKTAEVRPDVDKADDAHCEEHRLEPNGQKRGHEPG